MDIYSSRDKVSSLVRDVPVPRMFRVRQVFEGPEIPSGDVERVLAERLKRDSGCGRMDGQRIAVAVGSRGICNLPKIVGVVVAYLKEMGASPFIVPSMGSHGGGAAGGAALPGHHRGDGGLPDSFVHGYRVRWPQ